MHCENCTSFNSTDDFKTQLALATYLDRKFPKIVMLVMFSLMGIPGNFLVLMVYLRKKEKKTTHFIIFSIALFDFITSLVTIPVVVIDIIWWFDILDTTFCKIHSTLNILTVTPIVYLVFGVTVVRYYHVCKPQLIYAIETKYFYKIKCVFVCMFVFYTGYNSGVMFTAVGRQEWQPEDQDLPGFNCGITDKYRYPTLLIVTQVLATLIYSGCLIGVLVFNFQIFRTIVKQRKRMLRYRFSRKLSRKKSAVEMTQVKNMSVEITDDNTSSTSSTNSTAGTTEEIMEALSVRPSIKTSFLEIDVQTTISEEGIDMDKSPKLSRLDKSPDIAVDNIHENKQMDKVVTRHFEGKYKNSSYKGKCINCSGGQRSLELDIGRDEKILFKEINDTQLGDKKDVTFRGSNKKHGDDVEQQLDLHSNKIPCCGRLLLDGMHRTTLKLSIIGLVYFVSYTPWYVLHLVFLWHLPSRQANHDLYKYVYYPALSLPFLGCAVNPLIFAFVDPKFRSQCRLLFKRS